MNLKYENISKARFGEKKVIKNHSHNPCGYQYYNNITFYPAQDLPVQTQH